MADLSRLLSTGPDQPITLKRLEHAMDVLCRIMAGEEPEYAEKLVPLYRLLEQEIMARRSTESALAAARERARATIKRSPRRKAA